MWRQGKSLCPSQFGLLGPAACGWPGLVQGGRLRSASWDGRRIGGQGQLWGSAIVTSQEGTSPPVGRFWSRPQPLLSVCSHRKVQAQDEGLQAWGQATERHTLARSEGRERVLSRDLLSSS